MERLTKRTKDGKVSMDCKACRERHIDNQDMYCSALYCRNRIKDRLGVIEDILGDNYDLDRLRELVESDRDGRCVVLPVPLHSVLLDMSDTCRPDVLKDFRISATWTHNGIVFYCPWNIFNQNIEKGFIRLMSESATAMLEGEKNG